MSTEDIINNNHIIIKKNYKPLQEGTDQLEYTFSTTLYFNNDLFIKPFGSSRMCYENKNLLNLNLEFIKRKHGLNYYKIIIVKNKNEIDKSRNGRLFYGDKYNILLEVWFPLYVRRLNCKTIQSFLPYNYGNIEFNNIKSINNNKYKFGLIVPFYSRHDYVEQFLNSLKTTDLNNCLVVFVDESMTKNVDVDHEKVHQLVKNYSLNYSLIKIYKNTHGNMFDSILYGMDLLYSYCDFLCTIDSDTIHKKNWIHSIHKSYIDCKKDYPNANILASGFNVINSRHSLIEKREKYILKKSVGGCNMFFSKEIYIPIIRKCLFSHKWDTNIVNSIKEHNCKIITTNPSVIQHIGFKTSINSRINTNTNDYDYANDF